MSHTLYYTVEALDILIEVVSDMDMTFRVSCVTFGGSLIESSLTGPSNELLGKLELVGNQEPQMIGADRYSVTKERTGGQNGDLYTCTASTTGSTNTTSISLSGQLTTRHVF